MMGFSSLSTIAAGQSSIDLRDLGTLQAIPAVSGHEEKLTAVIAEKLRALSPVSDSAGNVYVTFGSGAPHRLIALPKMATFACNACRRLRPTQPSRKHFSVGSGWAGPAV